MFIPGQDTFNSRFIKSYNLIEHVRADTAGSAEMISKNNDKTKAA